MSGSRPNVTSLPPLIAIVGPTASGKSELALEIASRCNGEIISVDSMQVYRGLDIGTAKPSREERARIPHHLIDIVGLAESFDAAQFIRCATLAVEEIHARGKVPIFCGGTGLYLKAWRDGLGESPPSDPTLRDELEQTDPAALLGELAQKDPLTFEKIDQKNLRRVIRAIEVIRLTGKPFSGQRAQWSDKPKEPGVEIKIYGIAREATELRQRIDKRVDWMFERGLVEETRGLLLEGLKKNQTAMQAIGYRQVVEFLQGDYTLEQSRELVKTRTRQFAKRQMTWFNRQLDVQWLPADPKLSLNFFTNLFINQASRK